MKRILKMGSISLAVSMLFTGCGSSGLVNGLVGSYEEIAWDIIETDANREQWGQAGLTEGETMAPIELPDYYEQTEQEKTENLQKLEGTAAFKMKDGHSQDTRDLEYFKVGKLLNDGTFVYYYSTRAGERPAEYNESSDTRSIVHCMAAYNYKTGDFRVLHENVFTRTTADKDEDKEAFYVQMCKSDGTGDMFVYDNGIGYLYSSGGDLKFQTDVETFVRNHFKGYSIVATEAFTDDGNRIYVDLAIEKEMISIPEEDDEDDISEEDADKEAEELDKEVDEKTIEVVLVYDFRPYTSSIDQSNQMLDTQAALWTVMGATYSGENGELPTAEEHWTLAEEEVPSEWGTAYLYGLNTWTSDELKMYGIEDQYISGTPVFQWTGEKQFGYRADGYVSNFIPDAGNYQPFKDLTGNTVLNNVFVFIDGRYYELYGITGNDLGNGDYHSVTYERSINIKDERIKEDGTTEEYYTTVNQSISKNRKRDTYPSNCYLEGYWIQENVSSILNIIDGDVFCMKDNTVYWLKDDGTYYTMLGPIGEEDVVDIFKEGDNYYITYANDGWTIVYEFDSNKTYSNMSFIGNEHLTNVIKKAEYVRSDVDSKYYSAYENMTKDSSGKKADANSGELLDGENLLHVTVSNPQTDLLKKIEGNGSIEIPQTGSLTSDDGLPAALSSASGDGYLITSMTHGLVYLDIVSGKAICLEEGSWYGVWEQGDNYVAVGFPDDGITYESMDMAHARVMEFKMDDLYKKGLESILKSVSPEALEPESEESEETKKLKEDFDKQYKNDNVEFIEPDYDTWQDQEPGTVVKKNQEEREKALETEGF